MASSRPPYKRTLSGDEIAIARSRLAERWGIGRSHYWYPLSETTHPLTVEFPLVAVAVAKNSYLSFGVDLHDEASLYRKIRSFLDRRGVERVYEIWEEGDSFLLDLSLAEFRYGTGMEGYWFDEANDWVVYCSHENSVTLAGAIAEIVPKFRPA
jgi:hypothetical protein